MKTQYYTASSLDGFVATEDHSIDWLDHCGGEFSQTSYPAFIAQVGALAMGASTYRWLLKHREQVKATLGKDEVWPYEQPTWVFSHQALPPVPDADIRFVQGDVKPVHEAMAEAAGGKNVWIVGGGDLVGQFYDAGLLDELIIQIAPVTLGKGMPLLPRRITTPAMKLISVERSAGVFAELRYEVAKTR